MVAVVVSVIGLVVLVAVVIGIIRSIFLRYCACYGDYSVIVAIVALMAEVSW